MLHLSKNTSSEAKYGVIRPPDDLLLRVEHEASRHATEDLLPDKPHAVLTAGDHGGAEVPAAGALALHHHPLPATLDLGALLSGELHIAWTTILILELIVI